MTQPIGTLKEISRNHGDRLICVMAANSTGSNFHPSAFPESEVQSVDGLGENLSALVLRSGAVVPVALTFDELTQKIYSPNIRTDDTSVLDLRALTGEAAEPANTSKEWWVNGQSVRKDGPAVINADGAQRWYRDVTAKAAEPPPANTDQCAASKPSSRASEPGDKMPDGTIYAGVSPDTGKAMYAMPADTPLTMTFNETRKYAKTMNAYKLLGHDDWSVPTKGELNVLFNNRAAIGGFNVSGSNPSGWYWSSSSNLKWDAWGQRFSDGYQDDNGKDDHSSVRLVR